MSFDTLLRASSTTCSLSLLLLLGNEASAQALTTPGMPLGAASGQTDKFSNEFNPAFGAAFDLAFAYFDADGSAADGVELELRSFELGANAWIDPNSWAYAVLVGDEEEFGIEEAAVHYNGLGERVSLRAGRFFVDFGKQMQAHVHDLAYPDRPGVLAEYLGEELGGTGLQIDYWTPTGDASALRMSLGVFASLVGGHEHGEEEEEAGPVGHALSRPDFDELALTARLTQFMDVSESGVFQWGLSARHVPEFAFEDEASGLEESGLSNSVAGLDLTLGFADETGHSSWTFGTEYLIYTGDIGAEVGSGVGGPTLAVVDDDVSGYYAWIDRAWSARDSAGVVFSTFEHPEEEAPEDTEVTLYYTRKLTEFSRLRFAVSQLDSDESGDQTAFIVQFTNFIGAHAHGLNW